MDPQDYTPDVISRSLGLSQFQTTWTKGLPREELKILLCPSFHPELCLIFTAAESKTNVRVVCATSRIWTLQKPGPVLAAIDEGNFSEPTLAEMELAFRQALAQWGNRGLTIDGMSVHIAWRHVTARLVVEGANPSSRDALGKFVSTAIKRTFDAITLSPCRDGLALAAGYVGLDLPLSEPTTPKTQVATFGTNEERAQLLAAMSKISRERDR